MKKCIDGITRSLEEASTLLVSTLNLLKNVQRFFAVQVILSSLGSFTFTLIAVKMVNVTMNVPETHTRFQLFTLYSSLVRKYKLNETVPISDVIIDLIGGVGFATYYLIDFYSVASISSRVYNIVSNIFFGKMICLSWNLLVDEFQNKKLTVIVHGCWSKCLEDRLKTIVRQ